MTEGSATESLGPVLAAAEREVGVRLSEATVLKQWNRNIIARAQSASGEPASVIIKQVKERGPRFDDELAALRFLTRIDPAGRFAPRLLGANAETGLLVIEDLGDCPTLETVLDGDDAAAAVSSLVETARALGALHGAGIGHESEYLAARQGAPRSGHGSGAQFLALLPAINALLDQAGIAPAAGFEQECRQVAEAVSSGSPFLSFTVGDMAPSNVALTARGPRLIDFEYAEYRHACYDAMFWRNICPFPDDVTDRMECAYRIALAERCEAARDLDRFDQAMATLCAHRLYWGFTWYLARALGEEASWAGGLSARSVALIYLGSFIRLAERADSLPALHETARTLRSRLAACWPEEEAEAAAFTFPAFNPPTLLG